MTCSPEQSALALQRANIVKHAVSEERRRLSRLHYTDAAERCADILDQPGDVLGALRAGAMLTSIDQIGMHRMRRMLLRAGVGSPDAKLRALTPRQRGDLAWALLAWADNRSRDSRANGRRVARLAA